MRIKNLLPAFIVFLSLSCLITTGAVHATEKSQWKDALSVVAGPEDKLYEHLLKMARTIRVFQLKKYAEANVLADELMRDLEQSGVVSYVVKRSQKVPFTCSSGLDKVTPLFRTPLDCGDIYKRLYMEVLGLRGAIRSSNKDFKGSLEDIRLLDSLCPKNPEAKIALALYYYEARLPKAALRQIDLAKKLDPKLAQTEYVRSMIYRSMGDRTQEEAAVEEYKSLKAMQQRKLEANRREHERLLLEEVRMDPAIVRRLVEEHPLSAHDIAVYSLSLISMTARNADAKKYASIAIALNPHDPLSYAARSDAECELDQLHFALADISEGLKYAKEPHEFLKSRTDTLLRLGRLDDALVDANLMVKNHPELSEGYEFRSEIYFRSGQYKKALADAEKAVSVDPKQVQAYGYSNMGKCFLKEKRLKEARGAFETAIAKQRKSRGHATPNVHVFLARCYSLLNDPQKANENLDQALLGDGKTAVKFLKISMDGAVYGTRDAEIKQAIKTGQLPKRMFIDRDSVEFSIFVFNRMLEKLRDKELTHFDRGAAFMYLNKPKEAAADFELALSGKKGTPAAALLRYLCRERLGEKINAQQDLRAALPLLKEGRSTPAPAHAPGVQGFQSNQGSHGDENFSLAARYLLAEMDEKKLRSSIRDTATGAAVHLCLAYHFRSLGQIEKAKKELETVLTTKNYRVNHEYGIALAELEAMCGRK